MVLGRVRAGLGLQMALGLGACVGLMVVHVVDEYLVRG